MRTIPVDGLELDNDALLEQFYESPAFTISLERTKEAMDMHFRILANQLASGEEISHGDAQYARGWYACLKNLLDQPKRAAAGRERARKDVTELG